MVQFPCSVCGRSVKNNQRAILCDTCNKWSHCHCNGIKAADYIAYQSDQPKSWSCLNCFNQAMPYFDNCATSQPDSNSNNLASVKLSLDHVKNMQQFSDIMDTYMGENEGIDCKYVEVDKFESIDLNPPKSISLHNNFDELNQLFALPRFDFDIIGISETKLVI